MWRIQHCLSVPFCSCWWKSLDNYLSVTAVSSRYCFINIIIVSLRYIYCEKISLSGNNVMQVLHAAKKYQIPSLVKECTEFLDKNLSAENVLPILEHSRFLDEPKLVKKCLDKIEKETEVIFSSDEFMEISQQTLSSILDRDGLGLNEVKIFQRCQDWANGRRKSSQSAREILGDALFKIWFPTMSSTEFADVVCETDILTSNEKSDVLVYLTSSNKQKKSKYFSTASRFVRQGLCM